MMNIEIIAIGAEVLKGFTVNTNAAFISQKLAHSGFQVKKHLVVEDHVETIFTEVQEALNRSDVVLTTGGLGPTLDDLTRAAIAKVFNCGFRFNQEVAEDLSRRFGKILISLEDQATLPELAKPILNPVGTAPGLILEKGNKTVIVLPGVPREMEAMVPHVVEFLKKKYPQISLKETLSIHLFGLSESMVDPALRELSILFTNVECGIYPSQGLLTVRLTSQSHHEVTEAFNFLKERFHKHIFESSNGTIEAAIHEFFTAHHLTLSLAESCTGGSIAAGLTHIPGSSKYFLGGVVAYSNDMKMKVLEVPKEVLEEYGAVSEETVLAMALGSLKLTGSDFALAVSGIAGPSGGSPEKPVGTVFGAIASKQGKTKVIKLFIPSLRDIVIERTKNLMLAELYRFVF